MAQPISHPGFAASDEQHRGERTLTISRLTLFVGVPVSFVLASIYQLAVGTASMGGDPSVTGWRAELYNLPASVLIVGVTITSVVFAAKALRAGVVGATAALWLSVGGLFVVAMMLGFGAQETFEQPNRPLVDWGIRLASMSVAAVAMFLARRYARRVD